MTCNLTNTRESYLLLYNETLKVQNDANLMRREAKLSSKVRIYLCIILHRVSMTVLLFIESHDLETVKNVVTGNSSSKPDQTGSDGKGVKQSEMFNNSVYSRLGNNMVCVRPGSGP